MKIFYAAVIRPILEYDAQVWNNSLTKDQSNNRTDPEASTNRIIYSEYDYDRVLNHTQFTTLKDRRDHICVDLIKRMSTHIINYITYYQKRWVKLGKGRRDQMAINIIILKRKPNGLGAVQLPTPLMNIIEH